MSKVFYGIGWNGRTRQHLRPGLSGLHPVLRGHCYSGRNMLRLLARSRREVAGGAREDAHLKEPVQLAPHIQAGIIK